MEIVVLNILALVAADHRLLELTQAQASVVMAAMVQMIA